MKQSGMLKRRQIEIQAFIDAAQSTMCQMMTDSFCLAANKELGLGKQRLSELVKSCEEIFHTYWTACTEDAEADYWQEKLDQALRQIFGEDMPPFPVRYPDIKRMKTGKK